MQNLGPSKRRVQTCLSCYNRKQKCDRRYPCDHCTRRRRPEECIYDAFPAVQTSNAVPLMSPDQNWVAELSSDSTGWQPAEHMSLISSNSWASSDKSCGSGRTLLKAFGYFEHSKSNTVALLRKWNLNASGGTMLSDECILPCILEPVQRDLERMPHRRVLDYLIQYFMTELNWMQQLVHAPTFLTRYQQRWMKNRPSSIADIEFAVLVLRVALYTTRCLPVPLPNIDHITALTLPEIRSTCQEIGNRLADACVTLDWTGSVCRVQHLLFAALNASCEGRTDQCWELVGTASQAAQKAGIHIDEVDLDNDCSELEKELRRRLYCSLYILDSNFSRQLDRIPFLTDNFEADRLPRMQFLSTSERINADVDAPEMFTERIMQVRLTRFWRGFGSGRPPLEYDPILAEQKYEKFCSEYVQTLPPAFALRPNTKWDIYLPKLAIQRQLLCISIFESVCWNFRPLLCLERDQISAWPAYKQVLLESQKKLLAMAALRQLDFISALPSTVNSPHKHSDAIVFHTFEASVILLSLCAFAEFPTEPDEFTGEILGYEMTRLSRNRFIQGAEKALDRLRMLAGVSDMAAVGSTILSHLTTHVSRGDSEMMVPSVPTIESHQHQHQNHHRHTARPSFGSMDYNMTYEAPQPDDFSGLTLMSDIFGPTAPESSCSCSGSYNPMLDTLNSLDFV